MKLIHVFQIISGASMLAEALFPLFVPPEHMGWLIWKVVFSVVAVIALVSLVIQVRLQARDDHKRDKTFEQISQNLITRSGRDVDGLRYRIAMTAMEVSKFIRENPNPKPYSESFWDLTMEQMQEQFQKFDWPYMAKIKNEFAEKFLGQIQKLIGELHDRGIQDEDLNASIKTDVDDDKKVRGIADRLLVIAAKLYVLEVS